MIANLHYIPTKEDLSDLKEMKYKANVWKKESTKPLWKYIAGKKIQEGNKNNYLFSNIDPNV